MEHANETYKDNRKLGLCISYGNHLKPPHDCCRLFFWNQLAVVGIFCLALVMYLLADIKTSEIRLDDNYLSFRHFGRHSWSVLRHGLTLEDAKGGDLGILPVILVQPLDGSPTKVIKKTYFSTRQLAELRLELGR